MPIEPFGAMKSGYIHPQTDLNICTERTHI